MLHKIRITSCSKNLKLHENHFKFYAKYSFFVYKALTTTHFQKFLDWMLKRERIDKNNVNDIQIRMFPFTKENGNGLAGKCNCKEGKIRLFPKKISFCINKMKEYWNKTVDSYIKNRGRAALIHELLHLKYISNENKVRKLTKKYMYIFSKHQETQDLETIPIFPTSKHN